MMDFQLTLPPLLRRAETYFPDKQIVTRLPDKSYHRYTYRDSGSSAATASRRSPGTTTSTWSATSASRAAASSSTR
jgi:hypothetical protein